MKRLLYPVIKPLLLAVVALERRVFFLTGRKMRTLRLYHQAQGRQIQRQLDMQHAAEGACA